jgi:YgiT-type zinc finger domain-containing protein
MCNLCNKGHFEDTKTSLILEKDGKKITVLNVASFVCTNCHEILVLDDVINQLQNTAGVRIQLIKFEEAPLLAA